MKRLLATGLALGLLGAGSITGAGLAGAQPAPDLDLAASLSPADVAPGDTITVTSDDRCDTSQSGRFLYWDVWPAGEEDFPPGQEIDLGMQNLRADGSWTLRFDAPAQAGRYDFWPLCASRDGDMMVIEQEYAPLPFTVAGDGGAAGPADPATGPAPAPADRDVPSMVPWPDALPVPSPDAMPVATPMDSGPTFTG